MELQEHTNQEIEEMYHNHDCGQEQGCDVCDEYFNRQGGKVSLPKISNNKGIKNWWNKTMYPLTWIKMD